MSRQPREKGPGRPVPGRWTMRQRDLGIVIWVSFLAACVGTFAMFALLDPEQVGQSWVLGWETGVRLVYGLGFVFLFLVSLLASMLTEFMIRTGPRRGHSSGDGERPPPTVHDPAAGNPDLEGEDFR